jgi:hypothetical protein
LKKKRSEELHVGYFTIKQKLVGSFTTINSPHAATPRLSPKLRQMLAASSALATA